MAIRFLKLRYSSRGWRQACARQFISSDILVGTSPPLVLLQTCTIGPPTNPLPIANLHKTRTNNFPPSRDRFWRLPKKRSSTCAA
jgi:hypothetical protein